MLHCAEIKRWTAERIEDSEKNPRACSHTHLRPSSPNAERHQRGIGQGQTGQRNRLISSVDNEEGTGMWKPSEVVPQHRRRAVVFWSFLMIAIATYGGFLLHKAIDKRSTPDTSFVLSNKVYKYPDLWICPYQTYGCDSGEQENCVLSANQTEGGPPDAVFYPKIRLNQPEQDGAEELPIPASFKYTDKFDANGVKQPGGRGHCVVFETSKAVAFEGRERNASEYLDYIILDMYWNPGGLSENSTTCVPEGQKWEDHREWVYGFLSDSEQEGVTSTGIQLSYSCITPTSNSHTFNQMGIGLTDQHKYNSEDISSYKALTTTVGIHKNEVNPNITVPYARLSLKMEQQFDSWEIITEVNPFEIAEMFGNIGGFWDLLLILWPIFFVAASQQDPHLKPRTFRKSIVRGAERAAGITKVIARPGPMRRSTSVEMMGDRTNASSLEEGLQEERPPWDPPAFEGQTNTNNVNPETSPRGERSAGNR